MPARSDDHDRSGRGNNYTGTGVGPVIVRVRAGVIRVKARSVVIAVVAVVIDVVAVMVGICRRGHGQGGGGHQSEKNFMVGSHFLNVVCVELIRYDCGV